MKKAMVLAALATLTGAVMANNLPVDQSQSKQVSKKTQSSTANTESNKKVKSVPVKSSETKQNKPVIQKSNTSGKTPK